MPLMEARADRVYAPTASALTAVAPVCLKFRALATRKSDWALTDEAAASPTAAMVAARKRASGLKRAATERKARPVRNEVANDTLSMDRGLLSWSESRD